MENPELFKFEMSNQVPWTFEGERFQYFFRAFDIDKSKKLLTKVPRKCVRLSTPNLFSMIGAPDDEGFNLLNIDVDWKRIDESINLSIPLVVATLSFKKTKTEPKKSYIMVIDGWHRIAKAKLQGLLELPAFVLDEKETKKITL